MPYLQEQSDGSFSIQPKQNVVRQSIVLNNGKDWDPAKCQARFAHEVDDGSRLVRPVHRSSCGTRLSSAVSSAF